MAEVSTINDQMVGVSGDYIVVLAPKGSMTKDEAVRHAAWLVAVARAEDDFQIVLDAILST